jgi:hypothetical protein
MAFPHWLLVVQSADAKSRLVNYDCAGGGDDSIAAPREKITSTIKTGMGT